jgi:SAM-dependent methyltransferase
LESRGRCESLAGQAVHRLNEAGEIACPVCQGSRFRDLADPWRGASLLSDMRTTPERLGKAMCEGCGLVRRRSLPTIDSHRTIFGVDYALFSNLPSPHARRRQEAIAAWLHDMLGPATPRSILEVGCGDGTLLEALGLYYPAATRLGIEPALRAAMRARSRGIDVSRGFNELVATNGSVDLVVSVNVIEHTTSPLAFLQSLHGALQPDSELIVVCPDGDVPNYELLFYDHIYSIGRAALRSFCVQAGLLPVAIQRAPRELGPFHLLHARLAAKRSTMAATFDPGDLAVGEAKDDYLRRWDSLDETLLARIGDRTRIAAFGNGDVAALLSLYAPKTWANVEACVVDGAPAASTFLSLPLRALEPHQPGPVLLAVRPGSQRSVADRLAGFGCEVIRWDDVIPQ